MLDWKFQIAAAQGADEVAGVVAGDAAGHRATGTTGGEDWRIGLGEGRRFEI